ncbi:MAG: response regulator transcription factor [Chitinophagales bacterium]|nr:response regulator transcription factor [Saprospiraceae bacterium]MBN8679568.1 response regulator transcription factor [Chitinophagales bacterium]HLP95347.1 response regulator transcription factor [Saprospiraceae bacterium]
MKENTATNKILIVDDEPDILEFLQYNLRKEGYQVVTAPDGLQALTVAEREKPDLILLDIMMPEMDGVETCRQLRSKKEFNDTPIAFLTARDEDFSQIAALDVGGDDYITKPIKPRVLMSRINALLRRSNRATEEESRTISLHDLVIDRDKVLVFKKGQTIELPRKEFEILWLLASKPGRVFTREEIFDKIWGNDVIVGNRTIDVHIRKLREHIGEEYIKTMKGIGYKFDF